MGAAAEPWPPVVEVLGPTRVAGPGDGAPVRLSTTQRVVLCRLALAAGRPITLDQLAGAVWGDQPPGTARASLHNQVSRIRARVGAEAIVSEAGGLSLALAVDAALATEQVLGAELALAHGAAGAAFEACDAALACWRGIPFEDLAHPSVADAAAPERRRLAEVRNAAFTIRLAAGIEVGRLAWAIQEAERLVGETPHDEGRWVHLITALDRAGRRGDALAAYERARRRLAADLGLPPGPALRAAEMAVLAGGDGTGPNSAVSVALVGRAGLVADGVEAARRGEQVVLVGEAGVGKTVVLAAVAAALRRSGTVVAHGTCHPNPATAVDPLVELLGDLGEELGTTADPVVAFGRAVGRVADRSGPVALLVDDLDQAGPTTALALAQAGAHDRVALLGASRSASRLPASAETRPVEVPPLSRTEVAELASAVLGEVVDESGPLAWWLTDMSGGNPLLVQHLLDEPRPSPGDPSVAQHLLDGSAPGTRPVPAPESVPRTAPELRDLVRRRVHQLGGMALAALEVAAVCGPEVDAALLDELAPPAGVDAAVAAGLLVAEADARSTRVRFRHGAVQRLLYEDLAAGRRVEVHHRVAQLLAAAGAPAAQVAAHALAAAEMDPLGAARHGLAAARAAAGDGAHADAVGWCRAAERALADLPDDPSDPEVEAVRVEVLVGLGDALRLTGHPGQEEALFAAADRAVALGDPRLVGQAAFAVLQLGATTESGHLHARAVELSEHALATVTDPEQRAMVGASASLTYSMTGHPERCRQLFVEAEQAARTDQARRVILPFAYLAMGHPADLAVRVRLTDELIERSRAAADPVGLFEGLQLAVSVGIQQADGRRIRAAMDELRGLVIRVGDVGRTWALAYLEAAVAHLDGDLERAEQCSEEAFATFAPVSPSRALAVHGAQLLILRVAQGRVHELRETLEELLAGQPGVPAWHAALALALTEPTDGPAGVQSGGSGAGGDGLGGRRVEAARQAALALDLAPPDFTWLAIHVIGGRAAARLGEPDLVAAYREALAPWSGQVCWQGTCAYGPVDAVLARLAQAAGDRAGARRHRALATRLARSLRAPVFITEPP